MNLQQMHDSLDAYLATVRIETDAEPRPFSELADPFQLADIRTIAPAVEHLIHANTPVPDVRRAWWVRPRGHAKTADVAMLVAYVLAFSRRRRRGIWVAADQQQGCEGLDSIATLCRHNKWLSQMLTIQGSRVLNKRTKSVMDFTTSDVMSAFGRKDTDIFCFDEVTHWPLKGEDLWTAMYSAAGKRAGAVVFALMNAGFADTFQRRLRDIAEADPNWAFSELPDAVATWISAEQLADQHKYLPTIAFDRLWRNQWSTAGGDALTEEDVNAAFQEDLQPMTGNEKGFRFVAGVDLGLTRDFSAVIVLAVPEGGRIRLAHHKVWKPTPGKKVDLLDVERHILELDQKFNLENVIFDPWQMEHLAQRLEADTQHLHRKSKRRKEHSGRWGSWMCEVPPTASNLREQASITIESFQDRRFQFYPCEPLRRDLLKLRVEEKSYGFRLTSPRDGEGHGDLVSAFTLALLIAHELAGEGPMRGVESLVDDDDPNLSTFDRAWADFEITKQQYDEEQRDMRRSDRMEDTGTSESVADLFGL